VAAPVLPIAYAILGVLGSALVSGCGGPDHASPYAAAVYDDPPVYCYRTIGDADCYARPLAGAERRLVNYYGPPPDDYERPEPTPAPVLHPPPPGRPAPELEAAPAPAPAAAPLNQPTSLLPAKPSPAVQEQGGKDPAAATADPVADTATTTVTATAASARGPAMESPKPRPATAAAAPAAPLVIEVQGQ
jgi:hypothetical protein